MNTPLPDRTRFLAESLQYKVTSEFETVTLHFKHHFFRKPVAIAYVYGEPECALISGDEKYVVIAGCGLVLYKLQEPFADYGDAEARQQSIELWATPPHHWWTNGLHQEGIDGDWKYFRFVATTDNDEREGIYKMNFETQEVEKVSA